MLWVLALFFSFALSQGQLYTCNCATQLVNGNLAPLNNPQMWSANFSDNFLSANVLKCTTSGEYTTCLMQWTAAKGTSTLYIWPVANDNDSFALSLGRANFYGGAYVPCLCNLVTKNE